MKHKILILPIILSMILLGVFCISASTWTSNLNNGLVSFWKLDSNNSGITPDSLGINNATIPSGIDIVAGKVNNSANFSAGNMLSIDVSNEANFDDVFNLGAGKSFTVSMWIYQSDSGDLATKGFLSKGIQGSGTTINFQKSDVTLNSNQLSLFIENGGNYRRFVTADNVISSNGWYHIVYRYNGTADNSALGIFVNGTEKAVILNAGAGSFPTISNNRDVAIGVGMYPSASSSYWEGGIDEVAIWNRSLSNSEISALYNSGNGITYSSLTPTIQFVSPTDENYDSYQRQNILVNVSAEGTNNITIDFYNSTQNLIASFNSLTSSYFKNYSTGSDGTYYFNATACNLGTCKSTETRTVYLDTFNPVVDITYPDPDGLLFNYNIHTVNFTVLNTGTIQSCLISVNGGANITVPNCSEGVTMSYTGFNSTEGLNTITVWANDTVGLFGSHTHNFTVDTIPPTIQIISPINTTYTSTLQMLNISSNGNTVLYNWNGINETYSGISFVIFNEGSNTLNVYALDIAGNFNSTTVTFTVNTPILSTPPAYTGNAIYQVMNGTGAGLGIFFQFLAQALPILLLGLMFVGIIIVIGMAIKKYLVKGGSL